MIMIELEALNWSFQLFFSFCVDAKNDVGSQFSDYSTIAYGIMDISYSLSALSGYLGLYLHLIIFFPLFRSFNSDRNSSFLNLSSKLSPSLIASYSEISL